MKIQKRKESQMSRLFASVMPMAVLALVTAGCAQSPVSEMKFVAVSGAPKAAGPCSQGVVSNGVLFTAGFTPRDPVTGVAVQGDITVQSNRVFDNLEAVLKGAGCSFKDVVKVTVYMTDLNDFAKMNDVMAARFGDHKPARTTVQVAKLPAGAPLEIDVVARIPQ
jgi:2-iminobutanoate/2-iminopropanoate deaminase